MQERGIDATQRYDIAIATDFCWVDDPRTTMIVLSRHEAGASNIRTESVYLTEGKYGPFQIVARSGSSTFLVDEPFGAGGLGAGPNPFDLLSAALGSCALMTMRLYATERGWPVERLVVRVMHDRPALASRDRFVKEIRIVGDLSEAQKIALVDVASRCPIHVTVARGSDIETRLLGDDVLDESAVSRSSHMRGMIEAVNA